MSEISQGIRMAHAQFADDMPNLTPEDHKYGQMAYEYAKKGVNPCPAIADKAKYRKAKAAVDEDKYDEETYWKVVSHIYQNMGGEYK